MADHAIDGADHPRSTLEFQERFATDATCREYLERLRWPDGFVCPRCGAARQAWRTAAGRWMCRACGRQASVTAGTIFDKTRSPLRTWFCAAWHITSQKNGASAQELQRVLGLRSYETAWTWMHKFRRAMVGSEPEQLRGTVELDEALVGGVNRGPAGGRVGVMVAAEMVNDRRLGRIRVEPSPGRRHQLVGFAERVVERGSCVRTNGSVEPYALARLGFELARHAPPGSDVPTPVTLHGVHYIASWLKPWLEGTLHHGASADHLAYYLDEFAFRVNFRSSRNQGRLFYHLLSRAVQTEPAPLTSIVSKRPDGPT